MPLTGPALPLFETASELLDRIVTACDELSAEQLDAVPWEEASSLFVIATHAISATEWNVVEVLCGQQLDRSRQAEFDSRATSVDDPLATLQARKSDALAAMESALNGLSDEAWDAPHYHQFMDKHLNGTELVDRALAHTAEHVGHAEMTRQWLDAQG